MRKTKLLFLCLFILGAVNAQSLSYKVSNAGSGGSNVTAEINGYLSTNQQSVSLEIYSDIYTGVWIGSGNYDYYVNNTLIGSNTTASLTVDLTSYIPVNSVKVVSKAGSWSVVSARVIISPTAALSSGPSVSNVTYCKNATAVPLQATLSGNGTSLKWFTSALGEAYSTSAPTPATATAGTTTYYVSQSNSAGVESQRSAIKVTVDEPLSLTCANDKTVLNPASQNQVDTAFTSFLNSFSNNSSNVISSSFSSNIDNFKGSYAPANWTTSAQSPSSYFNHSETALSIGANHGGGGTTRSITIPNSGTISFYWSATYTGSGGYTFQYIINGVSTTIANASGSGSISNIAVNAGDVFQIYTWGYTQYSTYSTSITNFKVSSSLPAVNVTENGFVNTVAPANWTTSAQSPSSYFDNSASTLNIGANHGGGGTTRTITIPNDGKISFDWSATYTGSGGYTFQYVVNGVSTTITNASGSGSISNIAVSAGDVFQIYTWGYTQYSTYATSITNFKYQFSKNNLGAVAGFFDNEGSVSVTYTIESTCGTSSCTKTFNTVKNATTNTAQMNSNDLVRYYPNPTHGNVTISLEREASLSVYSLEGKLMKAQFLAKGNNTVNLDDFKAGIYSFRVITNDNVRTFNVVKQ